MKQTNNQQQTPEKEVKPKKAKAKKKKEITVKANKKGKHVMKFLNFLHIFVMPIFKLIKPFRLYGYKRVADGPCLYTCNHYGMFDPAYPIATTWEGIHFVAKKEAFETPVIGGILRKVKAISANRDGNDVRVLLDCFKCLKNGEKVCIFPEGTRNKTGVDMGPFEHGAAAIAIKARVPIVPMMIFKKPRCFRMTHVIVGEPFEFSEYYGKKLTNEDYIAADQKLRNIMLGLREKHAEFLANKKKKKAQV